MEARSIVGRFDKSVILKAQVDNLTGRNDELRREMKETRYELLKMQDTFTRANRKVGTLCRNFQKVSFLKFSVSLKCTLCVTYTIILQV